MEFDHRCLKKIPFKPQDLLCFGKLPFTIRIPLSKASSIEEALNAHKEMKVYLDGSTNNSRVGAAMVLTHPRKPHCILYYFLGLDFEHTVHKAELVGILLALHLVKMEKAGQTTFMLGVDNQAALAAFKSNLRGPAHNIAREVILVANRLQKRKNRKKYLLFL